MANPVVIYFAFGRDFQELGAHYRRARARVPGKSNLVALVRVFFSYHTNSDLDEREQKQQKSRSGNAVVCACASCCDLRPHDLAGALGIFFCINLLTCAVRVARANQIPRGSVDCICVIDLSDFA